MSAGSPIPVLLIEDNPGDAFLLQELLEQENGVSFRLECAGTLAEGLEQLERSHPHAALLDLSLPDSEGLDTLSQFRARAPQVPVIVLTGLKDEALALQAVRQGAQDYLVKGQSNGWQLARALEYAIERASMQAELQAGTERLKTLVEAAIDAFIVVDTSGAVRFVNQAASEFFGCRPDELIGSAFPLAISAGMRQEVSLPGRDNMHRAAEMQVVQVDWEGRQAFMVSLHDVTERKHAEEQVQRLNQDLTQRARELEAANRELEAFTYSVSHDLRAPLRAINSFSGILLEDCADILEPSALPYVQLIHANGLELAELLEALLKLSRLNRQALNIETVNMVDLVRQVWAELQPDTAGRHIEFCIGDLPACQADAVLIKQVWVNLLSNAVKFTSKQALACIQVGSMMPVSSEQLAANSQPAKDSPVTAYYVRDNGVGFEMQDAAKLFGVFQRLHHQEDFPGTGAGLAIVQRIIGRHNGRVWAESAPDQGATFYFTVG